MIKRLLPVNFFSAYVSETKKLTNFSWKSRKGSISYSSRLSKGEVANNCSKGKTLAELLLSIEKDIDWFNKTEDSNSEFC